MNYIEEFSLGNAFYKYDKYSSYVKESNEIQ